MDSRACAERLVEIAESPELLMYTSNPSYFMALEYAIKVMKHIQPRELSRCLEVAGKGKAP